LAQNMNPDIQLANALHSQLCEFFDDYVLVGRIAGRENEKPIRIYPLAMTPDKANELLASALVNEGGRKPTT
jgi:hypothetical protein